MRLVEDSISIHTAFKVIVSRDFCVQEAIRILFHGPRTTLFFHFGFFKFPSRTLKVWLCESQNQKVGGNAYPKSTKQNSLDAQWRKDSQKGSCEGSGNPKRIVFRKALNFIDKCHDFSPESYKKYTNFLVTTRGLFPLFTQLFRYLKRRD